MNTQQKDPQRLVDTKLEVVVIPVSDVERAKRFYLALGWRLDLDAVLPDGTRGVQVTPPGSQASIVFGHGVTTAAPGSAQGMLLAVDDVEAARAQLVAQGVAVTEAYHGGMFFGSKPRVPGPDPQRRSYFTYASFTDPDGNGWLLQEVPVRAPGRVTASKPHGADVAALNALLREAEARHGAYDATAPKHHWADWYAAYIVAREHGRSPEEAAQDAALALAAVAAVAA
jgi:catechol 2,3-dioxygenase-like lactoylglutathione lyase family enzyme